MPRYRLQERAADASDLEDVAWLQVGRSYHGVALLSIWRQPVVRLFHPDGTGSVDLPREAVERYRTAVS